MFNFFIIKFTVLYNSLNFFLCHFGTRKINLRHFLQLEEFRNEHIDTLGTAEQAFERSVEQVKANVAWMKQSYPAVEKWLNDFNEHFRQR